MPPTTDSPRQALAAYTLAVVATALATGVNQLLRPWVYPSVTPPFILAVAIASVYGGVGPGALATLLSLGALSYWYFPPIVDGALTGTPDLARQLVFLLVASIVTWIGGTARRQRARATAASSEALTALRRQQEVEDRLRRTAEAAARFSAIVANSSDAIIGKTLDGVITSWNDAAERIFGYRSAEMVGETVFKLIPPELHEEEREILRQLRAGKAVHSAEVERIRKDGQRIWISLSVSPIRGAEGTIVGAASIKRDITERRLAEAELRRHQEQLASRAPGGADGRLALGRHDESGRLGRGIAPDLRPRPRGCRHDARRFPAARASGRSRPNRATRAGRPGQGRGRGPRVPHPVA